MAKREITPPAMLAMVLGTALLFCFLLGMYLFPDDCWFDGKRFGEGAKIRPFGEVNTCQGGEWVRR